MKAIEDLKKNCYMVAHAWRGCCWQRLPSFCVARHLYCELMQ